MTHRLEITSAAVDGGAETVAPHGLGLTRKTTTVQALLEELRTYLGPESRGQVVKAIPGQDSNVPITLLGSTRVATRQRPQLQ